MGKSKTFAFRKEGKFIDIGQTSNGLSAKGVPKTFLQGYKNIKAKNVDDAIMKIAMGKRTKTVIRGKVVRIV